MNSSLAEHMNPSPTRWRRVLAAYRAGPIRDTVMVTYGAVLVGVGYMLHAWVTS